MIINLSELPNDHTYEDRYQNYMKIFKRIAHHDGAVVAANPPACWLPLLWHLNAAFYSPRVVFDHCPIVLRAWDGNDHPQDRTSVEVLCGFRPETTDALYKCDMEWKLPDARRRPYPKNREFIVTANGGFHRREVIEFMNRLRAYVPTKRKVVLVPCAADKPYPSPLHKAVLDRMPDDFYMINVTGVLGLVPQDMWEIMPWYDSGLPNEWRIVQTMLSYFNHHEHDQIVVYSDFNARAIASAVLALGMIDRTKFVLPIKRYETYENLLDSYWLEDLERAFGCSTGSDSSTSTVSTTSQPGQTSAGIA